MRAILGAVVFIQLLFPYLALGRELPMREGFEVHEPAHWALRPCFRPENAITADTTSISGQFSARLEARPLAKELMTALGNATCLNSDEPDAVYGPNGHERAELWEPKERRLDAAAEAWYGFSMRIDGPVVDQEPRLVIGQWKQEGDRSPILAQRFTGRNFHITVEQDDTRDKNCRILIASQRGMDPPLPLCRKDVEFLDGAADAPRTLPDPFQDCWNDMVYHVDKLGTSQALVEIWVNGEKIVAVKGRIGYPTGGRRYFKFGPYRDNVAVRSTATVAHIDSFRRGASFAEVDPSTFPGRKQVAMCK